MKLSTENKARLAFAMLLLAGAAAALAWYLMTAGKYATYSIRTQDSVSGLIVDAPVEFHGVEVGRVKRVDLTGPRSVDILLAIDKQAPVTSATVATITARGLATRGFTGYVYVSLDDSGAKAGPLAAAPGATYPELATAPSRSVNLDTAISQVNDNVQLMTGLLQTVLDEKTIASLKQSAESLQQIGHTLAANNERLTALLSNAEQASRQLGPLLTSSRETVRALQAEVLPETRKTLAGLNELSASQLAPLLKSSHDMVRSLQTEVLPETRKTLASLNELSGSSNDTVRVLQSQVMPEAYKALANLNQLSGALNGVAAKVGRDPSVLLRGAAAPPPGPGESR